MGDTKQQQQDEKDRISKLSDELLVQILSNLDSREAVQTCVLSKRWVHLWTTLPCLNLKQLYPNPGIGYYEYNYKFVTSFLKYRNNEYVISTLDLSWNLKRCVESDTDGLEYAISSLSRFANLKELTLAGEFLNSSIFTINCPNLQILNLAPDPEILTPAPNISCGSFFVCAPNLLNFTFCSRLVPGFSVGDGFPCINQVYIDVQFNDSFYYCRSIRILIMQNLITLLNAVRGAPRLILSNKTIEVLREVPDTLGYQPSPFNNLKFLLL